MGAGSALPRTRDGATARTLPHGPIALLLGLTVALLLFFAPSASASKAVVGYMGNPQNGFNFFGEPEIPSSELGGLFSTPRGTAVNVTGTGGAGAGDVYVADQYNSRVQQFTGKGQFIRAWGMDVISDGPNSNGSGFEICDMTAGNTPQECKGGSAYPALGGALRSPAGIAINQTTGHVYVNEQDAYRVSEFDATGHFIRTWGKDVVLEGPDDKGEGFEICAAADVCKEGAEGSTAGAFTYPFQGQLAVAPAGTVNAGNVLVTDVGNKRVQEFTASGAFVRAFGWNVVQPGPGNDPRNEVQTVKITATSGTFKLTFRTVSVFGEVLTEETTEAIQFNAPAAQVDAALEGLPSIGAGNVSVSGGPGDVSGSSPYQVTFAGAFADSDVQQLRIDNSALRTQFGETLKCTAGGNGFGKLIVVKYQWLRNGAEIPGATSSTYTTVAADTGKAVQCRTFVQSHTFAEPESPDIAVSNPATVVYPHPGPEPPTAPESIGPPSASSEIDFGGLGGQTMTCHPNSWPDADTLSYQWYRNGVPIAGATNPTYILTAADVATPATFQCGVTGTNAGGSVVKVSEANQFSSGATATVPNTLGSVTTTTPGANFEICDETNCQRGTPGTEPGQFNFGPTRVVEDSNGAIYTVEVYDNYRVQKFTPQAGPPALAPSVFAPSLLSGSLNFGDQENATTEIAIGAGDNILVVKGSPARSVPNCPDGEPSKNEGNILELSNDGSTLLDTHGICSHVMGAGSSGGNPMSVNPVTGDIYVSQERHRVYIFNTPTPPSATVDSIAPTSQGGVVSGAVNPNAVGGYANPPATTYHLEYKLPSDSAWTRFGSDRKAGTGTSPVPFKITVVGLQANSEYEVRAVASKEYNSAQTVSAPKTFQTLPGPPAIKSFSSSHVTASSADLHAVIDPRGTPTKYRFEYGTTTEYGSSMPIPDGDAGSGNGGQAVTVHIDGLQSITYHFRVVAYNDSGSTTSADQTFTFYPPNCPNTQVRQQTASNYLPDCRAYEIASAPESGSTVLYPSGGVNSGHATNPSRFGYMASFGGIPNTGDPVNTLGDFYVSTRTGDRGWITKYIGLPASLSYQVGPRPGFGPPSIIGGQTLDKAQRDVLTNRDMSRFVLWNNGNPEVSPNLAQSNAPFVFDPEGSVVDRWPTNLEDVPGGEHFKGEIRTSKDLSHFVFSSDVPFLPGAPAGAVYDNNTATGEVEVISEDAAGDPIVAQPMEVSANGSHILMTTNLITEGCSFSCQPILPGALYMRVGGTTHDVSGGEPVRFAGMADSGSIVYFTSAQPLSADDEDTSTDLFRWDEANPGSITRVSVGLGDTGNTDNCEAESVPATTDEFISQFPRPTKFRSNWVEKCGVALISEYEKLCAGNPSCDTYPRFFADYSKAGAGVGGNGLSDNFVAPESGDVYFFSPEQLTGPDEGASDMQNLFLYRNGEVRFIAALDTRTTCTGPTRFTTFCSTGPIARMQVSPDGRFAAFVTKSRLTSFDNAGRAMMYLYDANSDELVCASCDTRGGTPTRDVLGSQNGLFMTDNGRAFFSTVDSLIPQDTNAGTDVYEYVDGRPQLISQGTGLTNPSNVFLASAQAGLIGVSADGVDAYFATFDVLTPYDHNGGKLKVYDARTGGGFSFQQPSPGCVAADECHGVTSLPPPEIREGTGATLNEPAKKKKKKKRKHHKKKHKKKKHGKHGKRKPGE